LRRTPEAVVILLRDFYERMADQVFACGGTVEKYVADAVVAVFGVPASSELDACAALKCAEMMLLALDSWNEERAAWGEPLLSVGIGLNYGPAVVGDVGTRRSMCFTVVGDTVNTASRLQGLTRSLGTPLVLSEQAAAEVRLHPHEDIARFLSQLREGGEHVVRGRTGLVRVLLLNRPLMATLRLATVLS
jgi:adenylate cyclase